MEQSGDEVAITLCPKDPPLDALAALPESPRRIMARKRALCELYKSGILTVDEFRARWDELPY